MQKILKEIEKKNSEVKKKDSDEPEPDPLGKFGETFEVLKDKTGYYSVMMTRCDLNDGYYGTYLFYKLQIVYEKTRKIIVVFNRWGRVGEDGMFQKTAF